MKNENWENEKGRTRERRERLRTKRAHEEIQAMARLHLPTVNREDEIRALCAQLACLEPIPEADNAGYVTAAKVLTDA